jgi:hypothetical protein
MTNNDTFRALKAEYCYTSRQIAEFMGVSLRAVNSWLLAPQSPNFRSMSDPMLELFKIKLKRRYMKRK